jgi:glutamine synthetase
MNEIEDFLERNRIDEVECLVPDMAGIARGKILPANKFVQGMRNRGLRIPEAVFVQTVTGDYPRPAFEEKVVSPATQDVFLKPDPATIRVVPWYEEEPTAQVICDAHFMDGGSVEISSRSVLKRVLALYEEKGWHPVIAPELEFYLVDVNTDPDNPLVPPIGRNNRRETSRQAYGVDAVNEFDPVFEEVFAFCEAQNIEVDTLIHEAGAAQIEMNFQHHGQADAGRAGQRHARPPVGCRCQGRAQPLRPEEREGHAALSPTHRRLAEIPAGGHAPRRAQREFLPAPDPGLGCADQHPLGTG